MTEDRLNALYRAHGPVIYWRCLSILRDTASAEDATQETFMRVHRHLDRTPDGKEAIAWIWRIATNYCLNELRNRKNRPQPEADLPAGAVPEPTAGGSAEQVLVDRDLAARLVERAPEKLRAVAWLHHVDGLDQGEVAEVLGISRRTVINRLQEFADSSRKYMRRTS